MSGFPTHSPKQHLERRSPLYTNLVKYTVSQTQACVCAGSEFSLLPHPSGNLAPLVSELLACRLLHHSRRSLGLLALGLDALAQSFALEHLLLDLAGLGHVELSPLGNHVSLQMPNEVGGATVLDLVEEEGLGVRIPVVVLVVNLTVGAADVRADQCHGIWLAIRSGQLRQHLQSLPANPLRILQEFAWDVIASDNDLLAVRGRDSCLVRDGVQELAVEPKAPHLPVASEALDGLLNHILRAVRVVLEVVLQNLGVLLALFHSELAEAQRESHHGLLHDEGLPATGLDVVQKLGWAALALEGINGRGHGHAGFHASFHVPGLDVDEVLDFPGWYHVAASLEALGHVIKSLLALEHGIDDIVADHVIDHV
mmetsp:Transcript_54110/g.97447  ORF Transcript_54110/g.97447 Transcript_54110/m.97447 type:complete len:369 (-) Transcript_54110:350-1456(-)